MVNTLISTPSRSWRIRRVFTAEVKLFADMRFIQFAAAIRVTNLAVVHEGPVFPDEEIAVGSADGGTGGGAGMGKNSVVRICAASEGKLLSFQGGSTSLNKPAFVRCVYQATPKLSPLVVHTDSWAARLWLTMAWT